MTCNAGSYGINFGCRLSDIVRLLIDVSSILKEDAHVPADIFAGWAGGWVLKL